MVMSKFPQSTDLYSEVILTTLPLCRQLIQHVAIFLSFIFGNTYGNTARSAVQICGSGRLNTHHGILAEACLVSSLL